MDILRAFRKFFAPPVFEDEEKTRSAVYVNAVALINITVLLLFLIIRITTQHVPIADVGNLVILLLTAVMTTGWLLCKNGYVKAAAYLQVSTIWIASTMLALVGGGIRSTGYTSYFVAILIAGLLLGLRQAIGVAVISIISGYAMAYVETQGILTYPSKINIFGNATELTVLFAFSTVFVYLTINGLQGAIKKAKDNASETQKSNKELTELRDTLELRMGERSAALEKRANQLQAVSSVARTIASVKDINTLLPDITKLVSKQFGFYHVGIFLTDKKSDYIVLRAANSEGGARMLERNHKLRLDSTSIVGYSTSRGEPRVALDVGADAVFFNNPDLPDTHSEIALPLRLGTRVIGSLDVQSTFPNAFMEEDIAALTTLADQIAIAIENARLFEESQLALTESKTTFERYIKQEWNSFAQQTRHKGFLFDGKQITPIDNETWRQKNQSLPKTGSLSVSKTSSTIAVPIKLRGQVIGMLDVRAKHGQHDWTKDEITLLEAAAERAALALENARLVESAQRRAAREHAIGDISTKIGAVSEMEAIMQTAVEELGRRISGVAEVTIEIDTNGKMGN